MFNKDNTDLYVFTAIFLVVLCVALYFGYMSIQDQNNWEAGCKSQGGHIDDVTKNGVGTGIDSKGQVISTVTSETTYFCLSADGKILGIK